MNRVGVISVGQSNLGSILASLRRLGTQATVIESRHQFDDVDRLLIPGVGSFAPAMGGLSEQQLVGPIREFCDTGRPLLGICLGMQLLFENGTEGKPVQGLGLLQGDVVKLSPSPGVRIPHVGWNSVRIVSEHPLFENVSPGTDFYFIHGYVAASTTARDVISVTQHGEEFVSAIGRRNIAGLQFHPEKSQRNGEQILANFLQWDGSC